ncbi:MAG TPA: hypothetical protein VF469_19685 [Kofleriaceae bacterium]
MEQFYGDATRHEDKFVRDRAELMLSLIARLRALPDDRCVWGLTSHMELCLLSQDTFLSPRYVVVEVLDRRGYFIDYLMPPTSAPWRGARVRGEARSEDEAVQMVLTAMDRSGGWDDVPKHE